MARTLTAQLHQPDARHGTRLFELFDDRFLRVRRQIGKRRLLEYAMDIAILDPAARPHHIYPWHWLWAAGLALLTVLASAGYLWLGTNDAPRALPLLLAAVAGGLAGLFLTLFRRHTRHVAVFASRLAAVPLVEILVDKPDRGAYAEFVRRLSTHIETLVRSKGLSNEELRAGELRSLRKLTEQKVIDLATYESAKQRLLTLPL